MSLPVKTGLPDGHVLGGAYRVVFDAVDPTTGATVTGVVVSQIAIQVEDVAEPPITFTFTPTYLPVAEPPE